MHIAILTFERYNELDSLITLGVLNRARETYLAESPEHGGKPLLVFEP
jgi:hypothetical protein